MISWKLRCSPTYPKINLKRLVALGTLGSQKREAQASEKRSQRQINSNFRFQAHHGSEDISKCNCMFRSCRMRIKGKLGLILDFIHATFGKELNARPERAYFLLSASPKV